MAVTISPEDPRIMLLQQYCLGALKLKQDKWSKLTGTDESLALIANFLEKPEGRLLVISLNPSGVLVPLTSFPPTNKNKAVYYQGQSHTAVLKKDQTIEHTHNYT